MTLAKAAEQRILTGGTARPKDLPELAHLLHSMRGTTPMQPSEPKRGLFGRRKADPVDPLTVIDGHGKSAPEHTAATVETKQVSEQLSAAFAALL